MEVEELKQQLSINRKRSKTPRKMEQSMTPKRGGSVLSDYTKPNVIRRSIEGETNSGRINKTVTVVVLIRQ